MSAFAVCWHRGGQPVPPEVVSALHSRFARRPAGTGRELLGGDWAAWASPSGWAGDAEDRLPLAESGWTGSGSLRLDDRRSLAARLDDRPALGARVDHRGAAAPGDDAGLAWRSLAVWGDEAPAKWLGDYAIAAIGPARDRILIARGTLGVLHCFVASVGALVVVADDPATLLAIPGVGQGLEERAIAEYLADGGLLTPTLTFHRGIRRVPAAHTLVIARDGSERLRRHWTLPEPPTRRAPDPAEVLEGFADVVDAAVRDRLRGPRASILLSGGLDSPYLALACRRTAPTVDLRALTMSWGALLPDDDEPEWARLAAAAAGLPHETIEMGTDEDRVAAEPMWTPEPSPDPEPRLWRPLARRLASHAPIALLGEDLDSLLAPPTLLDQFRQDGIVRTLSAWRAYTRVTGRRPWIGMRESLRGIGRHAARQATRHAGRHAGRKATDGLSWVRPEILTRHPLPAIHEPAHPTRARAARALSQPIWERMLWDDAPPMSGADVRILLPYMDPRVISYVFSLPPVPWGQRKHLLRAALRGSMPDALVDREKTPLRGYYRTRVEAWRRAGAPCPLPAAVDAYVDLPRWRQSLSSPDADVVYAAWRVLELSRWLAQVGEGPA